MAFVDFLAGIKDFPRHDGEIGIEIETETKKAYDVPQFYYWKHHADGSLRDVGVEYVLKSPVKFKQVRAALEEWAEKTKGISFVKDSFSTSVHVHLNMLPEDLKTMGAFVTTYFLFENLLIRFSGSDRLSNLFCLPVCDAEETYKNAVSMFRYAEGKQHKGMFLSESHVKYAALNLSALGQYGSFEVRSFRGETDINQIDDWVSILYCILEYARKVSSPKEVLEQYRIKGIKLLDDVFGKYAKLLDRPDKIELIDKNSYYAASVAFSVRDWDALDYLKNMPKFNPTQKQLEQGALNYIGRAYDKLAGGEHVLLLKWMENEYVKEWVRGNVGKKKKSTADIAFENARKAALINAPLIQPINQLNVQAQAAAWIAPEVEVAPDHDF